VIVLAFDQATNTGWAVDRPAGGVPLAGSFRCDRDDDPDAFGDSFVKFEEKVGDLIGAHSPDLVVFEEPMVVRGNNVRTTAQTIRLLFGYAAIIELVASRRGVECKEVNNKTWKAHFAGNGGATKPEVGLRCSLLGWNYPDYDAADALGLWAYVKASMDPKFSYQTTPLYGRRA
jgi:Holliday junction resolvasome RuvABC endonuclease subunit